MSAAFYVLMSYAISIGLGKAAVDQGAWLDPTALDNLATQYIGKSYAGLIDLVVILDATALALAICVTIGRGYFALGRDGLLPSPFAKTSRHNTPWVGNLMVVVGGVGLILIGTRTATRWIASSPIAGSTSSSARSWSRPLPGRSRSSSSTSSLAVAAIGLLVRDKGAWWQYLVVHRGRRHAGAGLLRRAEPGPA